MAVREFGEYLKKGFVKRQSPDRNRAHSLAAESEEKSQFLETALKTIPKGKMSPNFVVESCYDIAIELVRAKMFLDGFNSKSHEAEVSYLRELGFSDRVVRFADDLRYGRNGIKYYGTFHTKEFAEKSLAFLKEIRPKLKKLVE